MLLRDKLLILILSIQNYIEQDYIKFNNVFYSFLKKHFGRRATLFKFKKTVKKNFKKSDCF